MNRPGSGVRLLPQSTGGTPHATHRRTPMGAAPDIRGRAHDGDDSGRCGGRHRARQLRRTRGVWARADEPRARELRRQRPRRRSSAQHPNRARPGRSRAPFGHPGRDRVGSADRHAQDGRATGRVPDGAKRPAPESRRHRFRSIEPRGLRFEQGRPEDVPPATGLRGHRGRAPHLVDAGEAWRAGVPQGAPRERDGRRTADRTSPAPRCTRSASGRPFP